MAGTIDHVVYAHHDMATLHDAFTAVGLDPVFGGEHANGITYNHLIGFPDMTYIELVSTLDPERDPPWWGDQIRGDSGPAAWAIAVDDIHRETDRLADAGIPVAGPTTHGRDRPDGTRIEWDLTAVGDEGMGAVLPFLIQDRTPRDRRVGTAASGTDTDLVGVTTVIIGVRDLDDHVPGVRTMFECDGPVIERTEALGGRCELAAFESAPVVLASPLGEGWLSARLDAFGNLPCGYLIGSRDLARTVTRFALDEPVEFFEKPVSWFPLDQPGKLGVTR